MKSLFLILVLLIATKGLYAQSSDEAKINKAVETLKQLMIEPNKAGLEDLTVENLTFGHSSGTIEDRAAFMEALLSGKTDYTGMQLSEIKTLITGDVATVRHKALLTLAENGGSRDVNVSVLLVWIKVKKDWKLLARQALKI